MFPEQLHVVPIVDDSVRNGVFEFIEPALAGVELLSDVGVQLICSIGDYNLILGPCNSK